MTSEFNIRHPLRNVADSVDLDDSRLDIPVHKARVVEPLRPYWRDITNPFALSFIEALQRIIEDDEGRKAAEAKEKSRG